MNWVLHLIPLSISAFFWWVLALANRKLRWFRVGELIFWDAILLILTYLVWLCWF